MKNLSLLVGCCIAALAAGCGGPGSPAAGGDGGVPPDEMCAMNPIAKSCGGTVESVKGALTGAWTVGPVRGPWGAPFRCPLQPFFTPAWQFAGVPNTIATTPAQTRLDLIPESYNGTYGNVTLTMSQQFLTEAMDGPYHVLYNTSQLLGYINNAAHPTGQSLKVLIPAYGIWIYAAHERSDYPQGAEVITFDATDATTATRADGACPGRTQFVVAL